MERWLLVGLTIAAAHPSPFQCQRESFSESSVFSGAALSAHAGDFNHLHAIERKGPAQLLPTSETESRNQTEAVGRGQRAGFSG